MLRSRSAARNRVSRRTAPVSASIHWKPLRDPHYVLASLQPDQGGRRQIFAQQAVLARLCTRAQNARGLLGLLLGRQYDCPDTGTKYVLIESLGATAPVPPVEGMITAALAQLIESRANDSSLECVGWCTAGPSAERLAPSLAAIHTSVFKAWQPVLVIADNGSAGGFFLHDALESRWFHAPFYEVIEQKGNHRSGKPTCTAWPTYLTTETVVPFVPARVTEAAARPRPPVITSRPARAHRASSGVLANLWRSGTKPPQDVSMESQSTSTVSSVGPARGPVTSSATLGRVARWLAGVGAVMHAASRRARQASSNALRSAVSFGSATVRQALVSFRSAMTERAAKRTRIATERDERARAKRAAEAAAATARRTAEARLAAQAKLAAEARAAAKTKAAAEEKAAADAERAARAQLAAEAKRASEAKRVSEAKRASEARHAAEAKRSGEARTAATPNGSDAMPPSLHRARTAPPPILGADMDDTTSSDRPDRYLALARREGFEVWFELKYGTPERAETSWILHQPALGLRLTLATSDEHVYEARLHYNLRVDDDALLQATAPEYRDLASRTIYVCEGCLDQLRARCRQLRATGALVREWKVAPGLHAPTTAHPPRGAPDSGGYDTRVSARE